MEKKKLLILVPLILIAGFLLFTWISIFIGDNILVWRHLTGLVLFVLLIYLFIKNYRKIIIGTVIYLILGICNVLSLTPSIIWNSYEIRIGSVNIVTPPFQLLSFVLLILFCILNFETLVDIYLEFKEMGQPKMKESIQVDNKGVFITGTNFKKNIAWNEITQMNAFKKDFLTWDRIELEIVYGKKSLTINEDLEGWNIFVTKIEEIFPTIPKEWEVTIVHPAFATNYKTIYEKIILESIV